MLKLETPRRNLGCYRPVAAPRVVPGPVAPRLAAGLAVGVCEPVITTGYNDATAKLSLGNLVGGELGFCVGDFYVRIERPYYLIPTSPHLWPETMLYVTGVDRDRRVADVDWETLPPHGWRWLRPASFEAVFLNVTGPEPLFKEFLKRYGDVTNVAGNTLRLDYGLRRINLRNTVLTAHDCVASGSGFVSIGRMSLLAFELDETEKTP